jgi:hypothetical protein
MWLFCDKCSKPIKDAEFRNCEHCGDFFCQECDEKVDSLLSIRVAGFEMDFCSMDCMEEYVKDTFSRNDESLDR